LIKLFLHEKSFFSINAFAFSSVVCHAQDTAAIRLALGEKDYKDYLDWVALGVGGLPHTLEGYRTVKELGKQMKDPFDVNRIAADIGKPGDIKSLFNLPKKSNNIVNFELCISCFYINQNFPS